KQDPRKQKARPRPARQRRPAAPETSRTELDIRREVDYIVGRACDHDDRFVTIGPLVFFSTETGNAWMLDLEDGMAVCLARDGVSQPVRIIDMEGGTAVERDRTFSIAGDAFTTVEMKTGRVSSILGYPRPLLDAIREAMEAEG